MCNLLLIGKCHSCINWVKWTYILLQQKDMRSAWFPLQCLHTLSWNGHTHKCLQHFLFLPLLCSKKKTLESLCFQQVTSHPICRLNFLQINLHWIIGRLIFKLSTILFFFQWSTRTGHDTNSLWYSKPFLFCEGFGKYFVNSLKISATKHKHSRNW